MAQLVLLQRLASDHHKDYTLLNGTQFCTLPGMAASIFDIAVKKDGAKQFMVASSVLYEESNRTGHTTTTNPVEKAVFNATDGGESTSGLSSRDIGKELRRQGVTLHGP
jgi:hypothetical protein